MSTERVKCTNCGNLILQQTAAVNNGLCGPCKRSYVPPMATASESEFRTWAAGHDIPQRVVEQLLAAAPAPSTLDPEETHHLTHLGDIMSMNGEGGIPVPALTSGLLLVGCCPNGDVVAVDFSQNVGTVHYISHEEMFDRDPRSVSAKVADSIQELVERVYKDKAFPLDYWDAS